MFEFFWVNNGDVFWVNNGDVTMDMIYLLSILVMILHFVSDFVFQNDEEATMKSSSNYHLHQHVSKYSFLFIVFIGPTYALVNYFLHFVTDYVSSRLSKKAFQNEERHKFFVIIGADQMVHSICLLGTLSIYLI